MQEQPSKTVEALLGIRRISFLHAYLDKASPSSGCGEKHCPLLAYTEALGRHSEVVFGWGGSHDILIYVVPTLTKQIHHRPFLLQQPTQTDVNV